MTDDAAERLGSLEIQFGSDSHYLKSSLPLEVRDAHQRVVVSGDGAWSGEVPGGIYSVNGMDSTGSRVRKLVQVVPGEPTRVILGATEGSEVRAGAPGLAEAEPRFSRGFLEGLLASRGDPEPVSEERETLRAAPYPVGAEYELIGPTHRPSVALGQAFRPTTRGVRLLEVERCEVRGDVDGWMFLPHTPLDAVPTARFSVGNEEWFLSLPLNPASADPALESCRLDEVETGHGPRLQLSFSPQRRVSAFVEGMRRSKNVEMAQNTLAETTQLLLSKYEDPAGATLACLALQRLGVLGERRGWVENLARDFAWIPDTQVLLASVLVAAQHDLPRALELLLAASSQRPLYTDGLSLALDLLRHWQGDDPAASRAEDRKTALGHLGDLAAWADWDCSNLTTVTGGTA